MQQTAYNVKHVKQYSNNAQRLTYNASKNTMQTNASKNTKATAKQVRALLHTCSVPACYMYTNKYKHMRTVKCYAKHMQHAQAIINTLAAFNINAYISKRANYTNNFISVIAQCN